ncbi:DUF2793 domain-containing protein [Pseudoruegeria sp. SK021]|uniref:DUF2793 domain-containing protein n=1 Tax=Pseudoruegeria sp. SK021 TaxID=1933035 RepID=UPI000A219FA1|nr:DUF2793 domain-containing protein [Pseudoruegeria sp. SK021]OSP54334.1 hypothetical protein BV911_13265 [Pseudoruegeria sp. SK021]
MTKTENLNLPLVQASQAQKHVTVNEAFALLDGLCQMTLESLSISQPPITAIDGQAWGVPVGASAEWATEQGKLAVFCNGGWLFVSPQAGWRGWVKDMSQPVLHDGSTWVAAGVALSPNGAATLIDVIEFDLDLTPGTNVTSAAIIPASSVVFGVTGRVLQAISGSLTSWRLGVASSSNRYGSGLGIAEGSTAMGLTGQPLAYYVDTALSLEAEGGAFTSGQIRLAVHLLRLGIPRR